MAYIFLPPRTSNYFPPGPPYLSGLGLFGLGDYAADLAAYKKAMQKYEIANKVWYSDKKKHDAAMATWLRQLEDIDNAYGMALLDYQRKKKAWNSEKASYDAAMSAWNRAFSEQRAANTEKAKQIAATFKLSLPQSFFDAGACISATDKTYWQKNCTVVKGLGIVSYGSACGMLRLPVCNFAAKPTLAAPPKLPAKPTYPAKPAPMRAAPVKPTPPAAPPAVVTTPVVTTASTPTTPSPSVPDPSLPTPQETPISEESKQANVLMGGLIVVAVLGGGYLVYRTLKKPKAQAA